MHEQLTGYWNDHVRPVAVAADTGEITLQIINDLAGMESLAEEWEELDSRSTATVFQTFDMQRSWWRHFGAGPGRHLYVVAFRSEGRLVGIAPFFIRTSSLVHFRTYSRLLLLGSGLESPWSPLLSLERQGPLDYLDIIAERGFEERISRALLGVLQHEVYLWDEIELQNIPENGVVYTFLRPMLEAAGYSVAAEQEDICPYATVPRSLEEYLHSLRRSVRRNLRYTQREFFSGHDFEAERVTGRSLDSGMQILANLHQKHWNAAGYPGLFADNRFGLLLREVAEPLEKKGRLWFRLLRRGGKAIAANLCFSFHSRFYSYISGFDRKSGGSSNYSGAGAALRLLAISDAIHSGFEVFDMGRGAETYKFQLASGVSRNWRITARKVRRDGGSLRTQAYRTISLWRRSVGRVRCEMTILSTIGREHGIVRAPGTYLLHLARRKFQNRDEQAVRGSESAENGVPTMKREEGVTGGER